MTDTLIIYTSNDSENKDIVKEDVLSFEDNRYSQLYKYSLQIPKIKKLEYQVQKLPGSTII